jgi:hypothetical protein
MALRLGMLRDAPKDAGAFDALARRAAEEVAGYESRLSSTGTRLVVLDGKVDRLGWMIGTVAAISPLILGKVWFG